MYKEIIISIIILVIVFSTDYITQKYTDSKINEIKQKLLDVEEILKKGNANNEKAKEDMKNIYDKWTQYHPYLACYIEHNELEKVETEFVTAKSYIESKQYSDALSQIDRTIFILEHIHYKYSFNLENIF